MSATLKGLAIITAASLAVAGPGLIGYAIWGTMGTFLALLIPGTAFVLFSAWLIGSDIEGRADGK